MNKIKSDSLYKNYGGKVYSFGNNKYGQLGLNQLRDIDTPELITSLENIRIIDISAGGDHSLVLSEEKKIYILGHDESFSSHSKKRVPKLMSSLKDIKIISISAGEFHSLILDEYGNVYSFGDNCFGKLGLNDHDEDKFINSPKLISFFMKGEKKKIIAISAGANHSLAVDENGNVYSFGSNEYGVLGLDDSNEDSDRYEPELISLLKGIKIVAVSAGYSHSLVLDEDGRVYSFGSNNSGQLGLGDEINRYKPKLISSLKETKIIAISAGDSYSLVLDENGNSYSFGNNYSGKLGLDGYENINIPKLISFLSKSEKNIKIIDISAGGDHSLLLDEDGITYSFGSNELGQLGLGDPDEFGMYEDRGKIPYLKVKLEKKVIKISAGKNHSLIILS